MSLSNDAVGGSSCKKFWFEMKNGKSILNLKMSLMRIFCSTWELNYLGAHRSKIVILKRSGVTFETLDAINISHKKFED